MKKFIASLLTILVLAPVGVLAASYSNISDIRNGDFVRLGGRNAVYQAQIGKNYRFLRHLQTEQVFYEVAGIRDASIWSQIKTLRNREGFIFSPFVRVGNDEKVFATLPDPGKLVWMQMDWDRFVEIGAHGDYAKASEGIFQITQAEFNLYENLSTPNN